MLLSDKDILKAMETGDIKLVPFKKENLGPDSVDICLGSEAIYYKKKESPIDTLKTKKLPFARQAISPTLKLKPHQFILANTEEKIGLSNSIAAAIEGRSSLGRMGVVVHMTAGIIHAGFGAKEPCTLTLEIYSVNPSPVILHKGMKIAQLSFFKLSTPAAVGYDSKEGSKYLRQLSPTPPKIYLEK